MEQKWAANGNGPSWRSARSTLLNRILIGIVIKPVHTGLGTEPVLAPSIDTAIAALRNGHAADGISAGRQHGATGRMTDVVTAGIASDVRPSVSSMARMTAAATVAEHEVEKSDV